MKLEFCKMQGAGNDFVVIDNRIARLTPDQMPALARRVCARRTSVGADGLMVADEPERGGDAKMWFFNSDGSVGEMCGNGARCFGRFVYEHFARRTRSSSRPPAATCPPGGRPTGCTRCC